MGCSGPFKLISIKINKSNPTTVTVQGNSKTFLNSKYFEFRNICS